MGSNIKDESWEKLAKQVGIDASVLRAVAEVESGGQGFVPGSSLPKVLFEGHVFHRLTQGRFDEAYPDISYPAWDKKKYSGTLAGEWERLNKASTLDRSAALQAASWGAFQIMGFNYAACGYSTIEAFVAAQETSADEQLIGFAQFIAREPFVAALRKHDWARFAAAYNGPGFRANSYDKKLQSAYERFAREDGVAAGGVRKAPRKTDSSKKVATKLRGAKGHAAAGLPPGRVSFATISPARVPPRQRLVKPDSVDLRDWLYRPSIALAPVAEIFPTDPRPTKDQKQTNACTGFALATVVEYLLDRGKRSVEVLSGYMLYSMGRRYDEWSDNDNVDEGSSLRGALKGWSRHGAGLAKMWKSKEMPAATNDPKSDWWLDAVKRPLGTYYRIAPKAIGDIHIALAEAGVVYASAQVHDGWDALANEEPSDPPTAVGDLAIVEAARGKDGHAFAIVGYTAEGFIIQNSWGPNWGRGGFAILTYSDWVENAMDCWVVQLGVVTREHERVARSATLSARTGGGVSLSTNTTLADHQISPFVIDMENNGELSTRGRFRTNADDLVQLLDFHLMKACEEWQLDTDSPVDIAIYTHGGLVNEDAAAETARTWIPLLRSNRIFPIFIMWETGAFKTLIDILEDVTRDEENAANAAAGGWWDRFKNAVGDWKDERIESLVRLPGGKLWDEMKENADALSKTQRSGVVQLFNLFNAPARKKKLPPVRLHLVGHSAGAIVHSYLAPRASAQGLAIDSLSLLAPAATADLFATQLGRVIASKKIRSLVAHLTDASELSDRTCKPYGHSLLYLISQSLEGKQDVPVIGMEKFLVPAVAANDWGVYVRRLASPGGTLEAGDAATTATSHGGLDDDRAVQAAVIRHIQGPRRTQRIVWPSLS